MKVGMLRHRVRIQESVLSSDGAGGFTEAWQDVADTPEVSAAITVMSTSEQLRFYQQEVTVTHRLVLRYRDDLNPGMRLLRGNMAYDIVSAADRDGRQEYLEILAEVRAS